MSNTGDIFTADFWRATAARAAHYSATFALAAWGLGAVGSSVDTPAHLSVPSMGVAIGAGGGFLYGLLLSVAGAQLPTAASKLSTLMSRRDA
ncbi:hypothetical protein [Mycobacterium sp. TY815]|uniref:hypothetical protein n=1 Tax=Mycobacterium sp. TY815 TaxID=3050581 RepID=UPI002742407A|nr:hypothetical protein [Mycobacterium sp. TY815]MDP7706787.1 hypothetical protein [Mycobacterium sp. TY815]